MLDEDTRRVGTRYAWRHKTRGIIVSSFLPEGSLGELNGVIDCHTFRALFGFVPTLGEVYQIDSTYHRKRVRE